MEEKGTTPAFTLLATFVYAYYPTFCSYRCTTYLAFTSPVPLHCHHLPDVIQVMPYRQPRLLSHYAPLPFLRLRCTVRPLRRYGDISAFWCIRWVNMRDRATVRGPPLLLRYYCCPLTELLTLPAWPCCLLAVGLPAFKRCCGLYTGYTVIRVHRF